jgi:hypothetical protein
VNDRLRGRAGMFMCIRYNVDGQEYWDNNDSVNYQVDFHKVPKTGSLLPANIMAVCR